jgi:hypothetical protein
VIRFLYIASVLMVGNLAIASTRGGNHADVHYTTQFKFNGETKVETARFTVQDNMKAQSLSLHLEVRKGEVSWSFNDPSGKVHWKGELMEGQKLEEERELAWIQGDWTLRVTGEDATGSVTARWQGKN